MNKELKNGYPEDYSGPVKRYCQFLKINPNTLEEYKYWHSPQHIWKQIPQGIRRAGILNMEIYIIEHYSFMIVETPLDFNWDEAFARLATFDHQAEWEDFIGQFQNFGEGLRSEEKWQLMERAFSLVEALVEV